MEPGLKRLTSSPGRDVGAVYSLEGDKILWVTDSLDNWTVWIMDEDGSSKRQLTSSSMISGWPSWSPDGKEIAYWSWDPASQTCDIWKMKPDGSSKVKLTTDGSFKGPPTWSPRGNRIAYTSNLTGNMEAYVMNLDGSGKKELTTGHNPGYWVEARLTWHPDGERLYYQVTTFPLPPGTYPSIQDDVAFVEIFMVDIGTGESRNLTPRLHENVRSVSSDGEKLACISLRSPSYGLWVMDFDGSNQTRLTWHGQGDRAPRFSPDGKRIVYWSLEAANLPDIWMINADGNNKTRLTYNSHMDIYPSWSPDGRKIVFESDRTGDFDIWLLTLDRPLDVDVKFDRCAAAGESGRAFLTIEPSRNNSKTLKVIEIRIHFDWDDEVEYLSKPVPSVLSSVGNPYQTEFEFQVPRSASLGPHFYDVSIRYSEVTGGADGPVKTYEYSSGDLEVGTIEHSECDRLHNGLRPVLELLNVGKKTGDYPEYLVRANEEFYTAKTLASKTDFVSALPHFQKAEAILNEQLSQTEEKWFLSGLPSILIPLAVVAAILGGSLMVYARKRGYILKSGA